jgi:hypothetical protein
MIMMQRSLGAGGTIAPDVWPAVVPDGDIRRRHARRTVNCSDTTSGREAAARRNAESPKRTTPADQISFLCIAPPM